MNCSTIGSIAISRKSQPSPLGEPLRVAARPLRRVARRHRDAVHALGAERLDRERRDECRVDPAGDADDDLLEAVLAHVVAEPELERQPHLLEVVAERRRAAARPCPSARAARRRGSSRPRRGRRDPARARGGACRSGGASRRRTARRRSAAAPPRSRARARARRPRRRSRASARRRSARPGRRPCCRTRRTQTVARARAEHLFALAVAQQVERRRRDVDDQLAPASARSVAGGPGCHMSSQIVTPTSVVAVLEEVEPVARREIAELVEDAVVRQETLLRRAP